MAFSVTDTTVEEIHEIICDEAARIANDLVWQDQRIAKKWKGTALRNGSPYNGNGLVVEITEEYSSAPAKTRVIYRDLALSGIRMAITKHGDLFAGMILAEARAGRNYFDRFGDQTPSTLFD